MILEAMDPADGLDGLETLCCASSSNCDSDGTPTGCPLKCAQKWLPVADTCSDFIAANFADMEPFTERCRATCDAGHCNSDGFVSTPQQITFMDVQLAMAAAYPAGDSAKRDEFEAGLQDDIANAVGALEVDVLIVSSTPDSVHVEIFSLSAETLHAYSHSFGQQLKDASGALANGRYSRAIIQGQTAHPDIETVMSSANSGDRECFSEMHTTASFSNAVWQEGGACCEAGDTICNTPIALRSNKDEMCYVPRGCTAECAALWLPFTNECGSFFDDILQNEGNGKCGFSRVEAWDTFHKECQAVHTVEMMRSLSRSASPPKELLVARQKFFGSCDFGGTCGGNCDGFDCR